MLTREQFSRSMTVGTHGTTYGGNPLAGAVAGKVLDIVNTPDVLNGVKQRHDAIVEHIDAINRKHNLFKAVRGVGLLMGCVLSDNYDGRAKELLQLAAEEGAMVLIAGANVVRFAPSLIISDDEIGVGLERFARACERFVAKAPS